MPSPDSPSILVIRRRYLGDIVLLGSVLSNLRLHWPSSRIAVLVERPYAGILDLNPDVNDVLTLPLRWPEWWSFWKRLRSFRFTHVLDFDNTERTALIARLCGASTRVAYNRELIPFRQAWLYTHVAPVRNVDYDRQSITTTYHALLKAIDVPIATHTVRLVPRSSDLEEVRRLIGQGSKKVLVHPGTRSAFRRWPAERFATVCDQLQDQLDAQVFVMGGPGELEVARAIREKCESHVVLLDQAFTTAQFAALLSLFDVLLCHDSGPMHIAAAVGTRVVALFGSQNATIWRPQGDGHRLLQTELPCPCIPESARPGPCTPTDSYRSYCVRRIESAQVLEAVKQQLRVPHPRTPR
ncbi:MAG: glycosyltransferase family 9 protein [Opitutaceae bacterium]|nr:glycosyltransferase family 9 protein [Opitutaceae bacterium]